MDNKIKLYPHNKEGYTKVKEAYDNGENVVGIVHATGTGKTYIALQLLLDNPSMKSLFVVPSNAIIEHVKESIEECGLSLERDFPNLQFCTYQLLTTMSDEELSNLDIDMLVLDEFHHIGAPVWGEKVNTIVNTHPNMKVFGMTAYTVRDRGTSYERDMALPGGNELFSDKIVSTYDIVDAMCDGVLPIPNYKSAYLNLIDDIYDIETDILNSKISDELKKEYLIKLKSCKEQIDKAPKAKDLIKENLKYNDKCIYFCPVNDSVIVNEDEILGTNDVQTIRNRIGNLSLQVGGKTILYETTSDMGESGLLNRDHFYNDTSFFRNEDVSNILRIMFAKNQYNEGVHAPGVTKVFMGRQTKSDIVFFEQIGRALSVRGNIIELTSKYEHYTKEELEIEANNQGIDISKCNSKEEIIERLLAPTIIDLVGNIDFIRELKDNLKARIKERQEQGIPTKITRELVDASFDIIVENEDIFEIFQNIKNGLNPLKIEQAIDEIYALYESTGTMPNTKSKERFSNGTTIGPWLSAKNNQQSIIELAVQGNEKAKYIVEKLGYDFNIEKAIEEIYAIYEQTGTMPNTQCQERFSNGKLIGSWVTKKNNQQLIIELAESGNEKAKIIVKKLGFDFTIEKAINEIYDIYLKTGTVPNTMSKERLSNEALIGSWIRFNKNSIIELADKENEKAKLILEKIKTRNPLFVEQAIDEIYAIYEKTGKMPNRNCQERFSNGSLIGSWISKKKDLIKELAESGNEKAKIIVKKLGFDFTIEKAINEIYDIYLKTGTMPNTKCQESFSNETNIGNWVGIKNNQQEIIKLAVQGNEKAKEIVEKLGLDFTIEKAIDEICAMYEQTGKMPSQTDSYKFSNGSLIGSWIAKKKNQQSIIELADQGNDKAKNIVEKLKLNEEKIVLTAEQAVDEIYEIYEQTGTIPYTNSNERFSNGRLIGKWLARKKNKQSILELANQGNEKARLIYEIINIKKNIENIENLCNEYNIDYKKNKKYIDRIPYSIFKAILMYFIDNNINYIDSEGLLISDFYMSNIDFSNKYGINIQELINNKTK